MTTPKPPRSQPRSTRRRLVEDFRRRPGSAADRVQAALTTAIEEGWLQPETRLGEVHLAETFQISRTPVREALFRLETEQLVERDHTGSVFVGRISQQQIIELYALREALDGTAARLAASHPSPLEVRKLELVNDAMKRAGSDRQFDEMAGLNVEFHHLVAVASGNAMLVHFVGQIHRYVRRFRTTTLSVPGRALRAVEEHDLIIRAIADSEPHEAEEAARRHMRSALDIRIRLEAESAVAR